MAQVKYPKVFHLATTRLVPEYQAYLDYIGAGDWRTDARDDHAALVEIAGRMCYRSFGVGLNKNVTRVREGNHNYIGNSILAQKHGSVLEHTTDTFALTDVSRILTHELVRHRSGMAFSQESGRYVRIDSMNFYMPEAFKDKEFLASVHEDLVKAGQTDMSLDVWVASVQADFHAAMTTAETRALDLEKKLGLDFVSNFDKKKKLQSAARRAIPFGMASNIIVTANHRAWRHLISVRTHGSAEEEIRLVQYELYERLVELHPAIYQDAHVVEDGAFLPSNVPIVVFDNDKV